MSDSRKHTVHLVCNAHLDPIWQWQWEEGAVEALSTFRTAVKLLRLFPEYVFVHNEAVLYEWVEEHEPEMFAEIQQYVKDGRWVIVGGWYLQPDCNIPGGESFVRTIIAGKNYFKNKFGVEPNIGYNLDSFGHNGGLPQILSKAGYDYYVHFRPVPGEIDIPSEPYIWKGVDGSEVLACRPTLGFYCTEPGTVSDRIKDGIQRAKDTDHDSVVFWGVGDHGGGASYEDLQEIRALVESTEYVQIKHSHPAAFCAAMEALRDKLPVINGDLQRTFTGCYTSAAEIKRRHRACEGFIAQAERFATLANYFAGMPYPKAELDEAWRDLVFNEFHDILAGSSAKAGTQDGVDIFAHCEIAARKVRLRSALALAKLCPPEEEGIPVYVYNPHSFTYNGAVEADFMIDYRPSWNEHISVQVIDASGNVIASQEERPTSKMPFDWRKKLVFKANVAPLSFERFMVKKIAEPAEVKGVKVSEDAGKMVIDTGKLRAEMDKSTGLMTSFVDLDNNKELLSGAGFEALVVNDPGDSWGTTVTAYNEVVGGFRAADSAKALKMAGYYDAGEAVPVVRVIESGSVRTIIEVALSYGESTAAQWFYFYPNSAYMEVKLRVNWNEPRRMLKLALPTSLKDAKVTCEIPYGAIERAADGTEHVGQRWTLLEFGDYAIGLINTGQYGFDAKEGELRLSLLRSPMYCHEQSAVLEKDRAHHFMDLTEHEIKVGLVFGERNQALNDAIRAANQLNIPALTVPYFPKGPGDLPADKTPLQPKPFLSIIPETAVLGALKQAEDGSGYIARFHESAGRSTEATVTLISGQSLKLSMKPFELKSLRLTPNDGYFEIKEVDLMERG